MSKYNRNNRGQFSKKEEFKALSEFGGLNVIGSSQKKNQERKPNTKITVESFDSKNRKTMTFQVVLDENSTNKDKQLLDTILNSLV